MFIRLHGFNLIYSLKLFFQNILKGHWLFVFLVLIALTLLYFTQFYLFVI